MLDIAYPQHRHAKPRGFGTSPTGYRVRDSIGGPMVETTDGFEHAAIGAVHEVVLKDEAPATLEAALSHERDVCHAARVVVDLTGVSELTDEHIGLLTGVIGNHDEQWTFRIAADTPDETIDRLCAAGLEGHLITNASSDMPSHVDRT
jgi:hypothetical protein